ncbi:OmpH family outer membrane protein [Exilibacterium tricleocarpae]|uniref:OmpH family outer membrane protein n=1 Tax=Exilibacterium tricleocarpae TaxID=2591008 RepID=A0A545U858_9GAMM|nr:OmpH family outer membrane protein [Exilibacterium tricleocarpae]TQV85657.1 OmpH family outer membrane protein [Exilibacterium tricleocarpae]
MTKMILVLVALLAGNFAVAEGKVAVFDAQAAMFNTDLAKKRIDEYTKKPEIASMRAKFEGLQSDLQNMQKEKETNGMTWSQDQAAEHRKQEEYKAADLQLLVKKLKAEENAALGQIQRELAPKVQTAVNQLVASEGIGLLLHKRAAVYVEPALDITDKITDKLNKAK